MSITDLPTKRIQALSQRQKSTGIDMEQNYVTVNLCVYAVYKKRNNNAAAIKLPLLLQLLFFLKTG